MATAFCSLESEEKKEVHVQHENEPHTDKKILNIMAWVIGAQKTASIKMPTGFHQK